MLDIKELEVNIETVNRNIQNACIKSGVNPSSITVVAATKTRPIELIHRYIELSGNRQVGENRVQEFNEKFDGGDNWQFIGRLQTNKVKYLVGRVNLIQSIDRDELLMEIDRLADKRGVIQNVLVEVNVGGEEQKGGIAPEFVFDFLKSAEKYKHVYIKGIMSVMPISENDVELRKYYQALYLLYAKLKEKEYSNARMDYLSAGMSNDYTLAIECGANMVRLGRALFGARI